MRRVEKWKFECFSTVFRVISVRKMQRSTAEESEGGGGTENGEDNPLDGNPNGLFVGSNSGE